MQVRPLNSIPSRILLGALIAPLFASCSVFGGAVDADSPIAGGQRMDNLIEEDEVHFAALWKLTSGGENAEGYWNFAGDRLSMQRRNPEEGVDCDRIYVTNTGAMESNGASITQLSSGIGTTTCAHFLPGDLEVVFASTHGMMSSCPPAPDHSLGYVWTLYPEHDIYARPVDYTPEEDETYPERQITDQWGYDAEATVSPVGDRIVFTSTRSGDIEIWTCDSMGNDLFQVTDELGYDGGAFFSHDGERLVFRTTEFPAEGEERDQAIADYKELLAKDMVRPSKMEIYTINADGTERKQITELGAASFAPYFYPSDDRVMFASNYASETGRDFDLFAVDDQGGEIERITSYDGFDSFPMFSFDGKWLVFASNRGGETEGETNLYVALWQD
jgi:TolB protein